MQYKGTIILDWIENQAKTKRHFELVKMSLIAGGYPHPHELFPEFIGGPQEEIEAADEPLPSAGPDTTVKYELEAPTDFGMDEYEQLMAQIAANSNGSVTGDQVTNNGDGWM